MRIKQREKTAEGTEGTTAGPDRRGAARPRAGGAPLGDSRVMCQKDTERAQTVVVIVSRVIQRRREFRGKGCFPHYFLIQSILDAKHW